MPRHRSRCCPTPSLRVALVPNEAQTFTEDEVSYTVPEGILYAPTQIAANCIAQEIAEYEVRGIICETVLPIADDQSVTTDQNVPIIITLTGSSPIGDFLIYEITVQPSHGTLVGSGNVWTYYPETNYSGPDSFEFTVSAGGATSLPATVSITVEEVLWITPFSGQEPDYSFCENGDCECPDSQQCYRMRALRVYTGTGTVSGGVLTPGTLGTYVLRCWDNSAYGSGNPPGENTFNGPGGFTFQYHNEDANVHPNAWTPSVQDIDAVELAIESQQPDYNGEVRLLFVIEIWTPECISATPTAGAVSFVAWMNGLAGMTPDQLATWIAANNGTAISIFDGASNPVTVDFISPYVATVNTSTINHLLDTWWSVFSSDLSAYYGSVVQGDSSIWFFRDPCYDGTSYRVTGYVTNEP